jgi:hypothetical protein
VGHFKEWDAADGDYFIAPNWADYTTGALATSPPGPGDAAVIFDLISDSVAGLAQNNTVTADGTVNVGTISVDSANYNIPGDAIGDQAAMGSATVEGHQGATLDVDRNLLVGDTGTGGIDFGQQAVGVVTGLVGLGVESTGAENATVESSGPADLQSGSRIQFSHRARRHRLFGPARRRPCPLCDTPTPNSPPPGPGLKQEFQPWRLTGLSSTSMTPATPLTSSIMSSARISNT